MAAFGLGDGGLRATLVCWGLMMVLAQVLCSVWVLGEVLLGPPPGNERPCLLGARALVSHMPQPWQL